MTNKTRHFIFRTLLAALLGALFLQGFRGILLQTDDAPSVSIKGLDTGQFPNIVFYLETHDSSGSDLEGITKFDLRIHEDNTTLNADNLQRIEPGIHWITAINAGPRLMDLAGGVHRIENIQSYLLAWMSSQAADSPNDYSLTTNTGTLISKAKDGKTWSETLESFQPDYNLAQPNLVSLSQAIDLAASAQGAVPQKYAVLYITPMLSNEYRNQLPDIAERARQMGVQVDVWLVGAGNLKNTKSAEPFQQLAEITGGAYFFYSGVEQLPNPSDSLEKLRWLYKVQYHSNMKTAGVHQLQLSVNHQDILEESNTISFQFDVLPPNPIFLSPPSQIIRTPVRSENRNEPDKLLPESVDIRLLVEFPDNYKRELTLSRLYADDKLVAQNTEIPFDRFTWDLTPYTESQTVMLKLDIKDEAGFSASTIEIPVQIIVETRQRTLFELMLDYQNWIISIALILTVLLLGSVFYTYRGRGKHFLRRLLRKKEPLDPLTQDVPIPQLSPISERRFRRKADALPAPQVIEALPLSNASLVRLNDWLEEIPGESIPLPVTELITLGRDAKRVTIVLDDPGVSPLHARIVYQEPDDYTIFDEGSIAGTWVNYAPISSLGANLQYGDIIQIGGLTYRFKIIRPDSEPRIKLLPYNEENA